MDALKYLPELGDRRTALTEWCKNKLIEHNLRLVAHIVKKYEKKYSDTDDLISIGTIGLVKGIDSYKPSKKTRLTTYAARCIENEILMYFRSNKKHLNNVSLNEPIGFDKDGNEISLIDVLKAENKDIVEELKQKKRKFAYQQKAEQKLQLLKDRVPKDKLVKIYITENNSLKETANYFNVSESNILQLISLYDCRKPKTVSKIIGKKTKKC